VPIQASLAARYARESIFCVLKIRVKPESVINHGGAILIGMMITGIRKKIDPCHTPGMHIFAIFGMISSQRLFKQDIKK
jgi:hypothetical protein